MCSRFASKAQRRVRRIRGTSMCVSAKPQPGPLPPNVMPAYDGLTPASTADLAHNVDPPFGALTGNFHVRNKRRRAAPASQPVNPTAPVCPSPPMLESHLRLRLPARRFGAEGEHRSLPGTPPSIDSLIFPIPCQTDGVHSNLPPVSVAISQEVIDVRTVMHAWRAALPPQRES